MKYLEEFSIGDQQFKDGAFAFEINGKWIILTSLEFKTAGSKNVSAQLSTIFVRLLGANKDADISFKVNGQLLSQPVKINSLLFNPTDLGSSIGIKAGAIDTTSFQNISNTQSLKDRVLAQVTARMKTPNSEQTDFSGSAADYVVPAWRINVDADLSGLRKYIYQYLKTVK